MLTLRRRQFLQSLTASAALSSIPMIGCSSSGEPDEESPSMDELDARAQALFNVKKIVILMMENRSFDHYFGHLTIENPSLAAKYDTSGKRIQVEGDRTINGLTGKEWNPTKPGGTEAEGVKVFYAGDKQLGYTIGDISHEWAQCHNQWNPERVTPGQMPTKGGMNGFVIEHRRDRGELGDLGPAWGKVCDDFPTTNLEGGICERGTENGSAPGGVLMCGLEAGSSATTEAKLAACGHPDAPMAYYRRDDTPVYHAFYDNFVLCDNWYSSVCGPTWPNRYYVHSATAGSAIGTDPKKDSRKGLDTIFKVLRASGINYYNFFGDAPLVAAMYGSDAVDYSNNNAGMAKVFDGKSPMDELFGAAAKKNKGIMASGLDMVSSILSGDDSFETRCKKGTLPAVSYIEPPYFCADDHPPHDIQMGQAFVKSVYNMLYGAQANDEQKKSTLLIVMYDEHGSFYDHQDPAAAYGVSSGRKDADPHFRPLGFRVPAMVVGPMVKRAHVSHTVYDHSSVLRTIYNWVSVHQQNPSSGVLAGAQHVDPAVQGVQTQAMIDEVYAAGFPKGHILRPLHAQHDPVTKVIHKPMLRVLAANDISDCLDPSYTPGRYSMPQMPQVATKEGRVLASMQFSEGQAGFAKAHHIAQPSFRQKMESAKVVMEHMYRLGAIDIG